MKHFSFLFISVLLFSCVEQQYVRTPRYRHGLGSTVLATTDKRGVFQESRVVIYNASIRMVVTNPDTLNAYLTAIARAYNGYVVSLGSKSSVIRIDAKELTNAIEQITRHGKVKSKTISGNDVTDEYKDYQIRLDNAIKARQRYLELLEKAEHVEAALKVEKELERLNGEIDSMKGRLERLQHLSDFSTITVFIEEKQKVGVLGYVGLGVYKAVKWLIIRN